MGIIQLPAEQWAESAPAALGRYIIRIALSTKDGYVFGLEDAVDHEPTQADYDALSAKWLAERKRVKKNKVIAYDISSNVNSFTLNGAEAWLDKATRVGLVNLLDSQKAEGQTETTLWLNGTPIVLGVDAALSMLRQLEIYAGLCYNKTEAHKAAIAQLTTAAEVEAYDYTTGYPERPVFEINAE